MQLPAWVYSGSDVLYVYDDFNLGVKFQTDDSVLNNLYTEPANF